MTGLVQELKEKGYRLIVLSNTFEPHIDYIAKNYAILPYFDEHIYSYQVGYAKPEPQIYEVALQKAKCAPSSCFFIDDKIENIRTAEILGIQCHHFRSPSLLMDDLIRTGILSPNNFKT
jgi:putative hydrolase of the HAD superfamily